MIKQQILIVSDDPELYTPIQYKLGGDTTETHCVSSISAAVSHIMKNGYCLIMLDLQLSGMDKAEMIRIIRIMQHIPVVVVSEHLESSEIVALYHTGMDAYIEKPVDMDVCAAQIGALIALCIRAAEKSWKLATLAFGSSLVISPYHRQVLVDGTSIELTRKEFDLLHHFAQHPHQVFSVGQLYEQIWENAFDMGGESTVMVHINTLRKKLGALGPMVIQTVRGFGYRFVPPPDTNP